MTTKFPSSIDNSTTLPTVTDNNTPVQGKIFNRLRDAVLAIETELGTKPSSSYGTVKSRLDTLENNLNNTIGVQLNKDLGGSTIEPLVIGIQGNPISNVEPTSDQILVWNGVAWSPTNQKDVNDILPNPSTPSLVGQSILWDGTQYIAGYYAQDDVLPPVFITLAPSISFAEVGQPIVHPVFTATYSGPGSITNANLKDSDNNILQNLSNPNSFTSDFSFTKNTFDGYVDFTVTATQNARFTKSDTKRITWGQKTYWGLGPVGQTGAAWITSLSNNMITNKKSINFTLTAGPTQKIYFACRSGYGSVVFTIKNVQGGFTKVGTHSVTNTFGFAENYDLYESNSLNLGASNVLVSDGLELLLVNALAEATVFGSPFNVTEINATVYGTSVVTQGPGVSRNKVLKTINNTTCDWINFYPNVVIVSGNYIAPNEPQVILADSLSGPVSITLPSSALEPGMEIVVKDLGNALSNGVTLGGSGDIDGIPVYSINTNKGYVRIVTDGSDWFIVGEG